MPNRVMQLERLEGRNLARYVDAAPSDGGNAAREVVVLLREIRDRLNSQQAPAALPVQPTPKPQPARESLREKIRRFAD